MHRGGPYLGERAIRKIAFIECFSGAAGDMIVAACLDAGVPQEYLAQELARLDLPEEAQFNITRAKRAGVAATVFAPAAKNGPRHPMHQDHPPCRNLSAILEIIQRADLKEPVKKRACRIFQTLARAEAEVHGTTVDQIHFHEVGGYDAIMDIVGACVAFDYLGIDCFYCSPLVVGSGTVRCQHGVMPVPAPATAAMIRGIEIIPTEIRKELLTPTGAAILTTVAEGFGPMPACRITSVGYGAGTLDIPDFPNVVRIFIGTASSRGPQPSGGVN